MPRWKILRPLHWVKNVIVFFPLIFSNNLLNRPLLFKELLALFVFCLLASSAYILNDIADLKRDHSHLMKQQRPLASGRLKKLDAWILFVIFVALSLALSWSLGKEVFLLALLYLGLNFLYSLWIKTLVPLDIILVASFYVIRVLYGAQAIGVEPTHWIILTTLFAALYIVSLKRKAEFALASKNGVYTRTHLEQFLPSVVQIFVPMALTSAIICYALYSSTFAKPFIWSTLLVVALGLRTALLSEHSLEKFETPEKTLLTDPQMMILGLSWLVFVVVYHWPN